MHISVVALSREVGSEGEEVGRLVAEALGYRYVDYEVISKAAQEARVSPETITRAEATPPFLTRVLESLARNPSVPLAGWADPIPLTQAPIYTSTDYRQFVEQVVREVAAEGRAVIIGHAAAFLLAAQPGVLRVFICGSKEARVRRTMTGMGVPEKEALETVKRVDKERQEYFQRFYGVEWTKPALYDVCLNTDRMPAATAADLLVRLMERS